MNWYYESGGQQQGPVTDAELDRLITEGRVTQTTLVWREGQASWQPLRDARPTPGVPGAAAPAPTAAPSASPAAPVDAVRCSSCGNTVPRAESIQMGERIICSACKPAVMQNLAQGGSIPTYGDLDRDGPPWEHREQLGFFPALLETIKGALLAPSATFTKMRCEGGLTAPYLYFLITGSLGFVGYSIVFFFTEYFMVPQVSQGISEINMGKGLLFCLALLILIVVAPIMVSIMLFLYSGIMHLCLMICGGAKKPFETTFRAIGYAFGSLFLLYCIPVCGGLVVATWGIAVTCIAMARAHDTDTWRGVLAFFLPTILCCAIILIAMVAFAGIGAASAHH